MELVVELIKMLLLWVVDDAKTRYKREGEFFIHLQRAFQNATQPSYPWCSSCELTRRRCVLASLRERATRKDHSTMGPAVAVGRWNRATVSSGVRKAA
jgi:hypothetical protein